MNNQPTRNPGTSGFQKMIGKLLMAAAILLVCRFCAAADAYPQAPPMPTLTDEVVETATEPESVEPLRFQMVIRPRTVVWNDVPGGMPSDDTVSHAHLMSGCHECGATHVEAVPIVQRTYSIPVRYATGTVLYPYSSPYYLRNIYPNSLGRRVYSYLYPGSYYRSGIYFGHSGTSLYYPYLRPIAY